MSAPASTAVLDPERSGLQESRPLVVQDTGRPGRGAMLAGKYRLEMLLGEGGMACVWSAYNVALELPVAIKLLRSGPGDERLTQRLRHEARAAARLVHPSIVRIFDVAVADNGDPFIVMELLHGRSLAEELRSGPISSLRAVQLLLPIVEALASAHAQGVVHRDLKPDNVFLSTEGDQLQPKLLDFGIAKLAGASPLAAMFTNAGTTPGSSDYLSPEQVRGDDVDYRSDIWSLCVVLYQAISGVAPFCSEDRRLTLDAILKAEPKTLPLGNGVDERLARLIGWGLAEDPAERPASMRELGSQLAWWLISQGVADDVTGASLASKWLVGGGASRAHEGRATPSTPAPPRERDQRSQRLVLARFRQWGLLAAAGLLLVSGSIAWASSRVATSYEATERAAPQPEPLVVAVAEASADEPVVIAGTPPSPPPITPITPTAAVVAPVAPPAAEPASTPEPSNVRGENANRRASRPASRLPF